MASPRVLHIVDPCLPNPPSAGGPCTLRHAADLIHHLPQFAHDVFVLGTRRDVLLAQACGLNVAAAFCPPQMLPLGGRGGASRSIRAIQQQCGTHVAVHGWTPRAAMLGSLMLPHVPRVCSLLVGQVRGFNTRALRILLTQHRTQVIAANDAIKQECRAAELPSGRMRIIGPAVDPSVIATNDRAAVRQRWEVDDDAMVIGALCEPASAADARIAVRVIASLRLTGRNVRMVMHSDALRRVDAKWWSKRLGSNHLLIFDDLAAQPWRMAAALDAAWIIAAVEGSTVRPASCLPLRWAMAAGLPTVVEQAGAATQMIEDQRNGLLVPPGEIPVILDRLAHLYDDHDWAAPLGAAGRAYTQEHAAMEHYAAQLAAMYRG